MEILVTGAAGFIGFHTAVRLLADGHRVVWNPQEWAGNRGLKGVATS